MDNLKAIKRINCLSQQFKVTNLGVWIIRLVLLCDNVNPGGKKKKLSHSIKFWSLKQKRHDCMRTLKELTTQNCLCNMNLPVI